MTTRILTLIILGDFNHCNPRKNMPKLHQFVTFPTSANKTLGHCYSKSQMPSQLDQNPILESLITGNSAQTSLKQKAQDNTSRSQNH